MNKSIQEIMSESTSLEREIAKRILRTGRLNEAKEAVRSINTAFTFVQAIKRKHINELEAYHVLGHALYLISVAYLYVYSDVTVLTPELIDAVGVQNVIDVIKKEETDE